jgi:hypothetical protein
MKGEIMARSKKTKVETTTIELEDAVKKEAVVKNETVKKDDKPIVPKDIDPGTYVSVRNGFQGKLIYISPRTKEEYTWDEFGDEQEMELRELRNAKSSAKGFFENNWFMFDEEFQWVIPYLGLSKFYENSIRLDEFDKIFELKPEILAKAIGKMPAGQKNSLMYRAMQLVNEGAIDSRKMISTLEEVFGIELIER